MSDGTTRVDGGGEGKNSTTSDGQEGGEQVDANNERRTKRKLARGAWAIAKEKAQIHMSSEKIQGATLTMIFFACSPSFDTTTRQL